MGQFTYRTKTEKKRALESIRTKAVKLFNSDDMSLNDFKKIDDVVKRNLKKMK